MLEIHYNNEDLRDGIVLCSQYCYHSMIIIGVNSGNIIDYVDSSGIRFYYTSKLRLHDAAVLEVGLEYTPKMAIPPQQEHYVLSGHCIIECTEVVSQFHILSTVQSGKGKADIKSLKLNDNSLTTVPDIRKEGRTRCKCFSPSV